LIVRSLRSLGSRSLRSLGSGLSLSHAREQVSKKNRGRLGGWHASLTG